MKPREYIVISAGNGVELEDELNEWGKNGWRLVSLIDVGDNFIAVMEREANETEGE